MSDMSVLENMLGHLEFLGCQIVERNTDVVKIMTPVGLGFTVRPTEWGLFFRFVTPVNSHAKSNVSGCLQAINTLNQYAVTTRFVYTQDDYLLAQAWFPTMYDKAMFGRFWQAFKYDIDFTKRPEIKDILPYLQ